MKKTKLTRSLLAACSIVALSAVMYGCTHSGGPSQDDLDAANEATAAAEAEAKTNAEAAATAVAAKTEADAAAEVARLAQVAADAAAEEARLAQVAAEAQSALDAQAKIDADAAAAEAADAAQAAQAAAVAAQMVADEAIKAQMDAEAARDTAQMALEGNQQQMQDDAKADHFAELKRLHSGLSNDDGDVEEGFDTDPAISATHGMPARSGAAPEDNDEIMTGGADEIAGFRGDQSGWSGTDYKNTQTIYTDIDKTNLIPFGQVYDATDGKLDFVAAPEDDSGDEDLSENDKIVSDDFVKVNFRVHNFNIDGPDADSDPDHVAFEGTYHGADGVYRCSGGSDAEPPASTCISTRNSDGSLTLSLGWTFTPNPDAMVKETDGIYMYFGWWLRENLKAPELTGALSVQTFAGVKDGAGDRTESIGIEDLIGTATFEGAAVGKFTVYDPSTPGGDAIVGGHFTADATLEADFGTMAGDDAAGSISGTIDNFMFGDVAPEDAWSVALMSTGLLDVATVDALKTRTAWQTRNCGTSPPPTTPSSPPTPRPAPPKS